MRSVVLAVSLGLNLAAGAAAACSCVEPEGSIHEQLKEASESASHVYLARATAIEGDENDFHTRTELEVLERFKGDVVPKQKFWVQSGGGGDCTLAFTVGSKYLVYAYGGAQGVGYCTRTREDVRDDDAEVLWLRTGRLPAIPVALQREVVECQECTLESVTTSLVGLPVGNTCNLSVWRNEAVGAFEKKAPFWTQQGWDPKDPGHNRAVGFSSRGWPFELDQAPFWSVKEACLQRVSRRWCTELKVSNDPTRDRLPLTCSEPSATVQLCDERTSRRARWNPIEALDAKQCEWRDPVHPVCWLKKERSELTKDSVVYPLLKCSPDHDNSRRHLCRIVEAPEPGALKKEPKAPVP